jgi:hypothetical protein
MLRLPPKGWNVKRIQGYAVWSKKVTDVSEVLMPPWTMLWIKYQGSLCPALPQEDLEKFLEAYYQQMSVLKK